MIIHISLEFSSLENAKTILEDLLEMERLRSFRIDEKLSQAIFKTPPPDNIVVYRNNPLNIEAFINKEPGGHNKKNYHHICIAVDNIDKFIQKSRLKGLEIIQYKKEDKIVTFLKDNDDNLYEIKNKVLSAKK